MTEAQLQQLLNQTATPPSLPLSGEGAQNPPDKGDTGGSVSSPTSEGGVPATSGGGGSDSTIMQ